MAVWNTLPMSDPRLRPSEHMTEAEFLALGESNYRQELLDGKFEVSFASTPHTEICVLLKLALTTSARKAGFSVRMPNLRLAPNWYVIPDIAVGKLHRTERWQSAANTVLVGEITSPSNAFVDRRTKKRAYAEAGIDWYLLIEPDFAAYRAVTLLLYRREGLEYLEHAIAKPGETLVADGPFRMKLSTDDLVDFA